MPITINNGMSAKRVAELIESYGSHTQCWPEEERLAAIAYLESSESLQQLMHEAEQLDAELLATQVDEPVNEALLTLIVDELPAQPVVEKPRWLQRLPMAMAAAFTGVAIMLVLMNGPEQVLPTEQIALQELDYWLWQDVTDQVSFDTTEEASVDFMNML